jgi:hypothetical protein
MRTEVKAGWPLAEEPEYDNIKNSLAGSSSRKLMGCLRHITLPLWLAQRGIGPASGEILS